MSPLYYVQMAGQRRLLLLKKNSKVSVYQLSCIDQNWQEQTQAMQAQHSHGDHSYTIDRLEMGNTEPF